jgi:hypothetical protein
MTVGFVSRKIVPQDILRYPTVHAQPRCLYITLNVIGCYLKDENAILQSAFHDKVPAGRCLLWCGSGGKCTGGWTKGLLLVEKSVTHQGVRVYTSAS